MSSVVLHNNRIGAYSEIEVEGVFIEVGRVPNTELAKRADIERDERGYIVVELYKRTNIEGVYAAGDVTTSPQKHIVTVVSMRSSRTRKPTNTLGGSILSEDESPGLLLRWDRPYHPSDLT